MSNLTKKLLVEGEADTRFFSACCREIGLDDVWVGPPQEFSGAGTGKGNAISLLPDLIDEMEQGQVTRLAIIVDADYAKTGGLGYEETLKKIQGILALKGYKIPKAVDGHKGGRNFVHSDGLPDVGLWIMPDNKNPGFLEDFIRVSLVATENKLFAVASSTVRGLDRPKFKPLHVSKADVATWLAWQSIPGQGLNSVIGSKLLNFKKGLGKEFADWLKLIYA